MTQTFKLALMILISILISSPRVDMGLVLNNKIDEASGIASSRNNSDLLWVHNDSGDLARVYAIGSDGSDLGILRLPGEIAFDWEDMCIGPGPEEGVDYIYIGDIGNNFSRKNKSRIFRFKEPKIDFDSISIPFDIKIRDVDKIIYSLPDENRDSETLMIDPITRDIHIITKRESSPHIYTLSYPQSTSSDILADFIGSIEISPDKSYRMSDRIVSGDISRDGRMVIIKTLHQIFLIRKEPSSPFSSIISNPQLELKYVLEPQGEAVCWKWDQSGYFTISEESENKPAHLYFYPM